MLQGLFGWYNGRKYYKKMVVQDERFSQPLENPLRPAALFVPIKGVASNFEGFVRGLLTQDYPAYHLVITVESDADPTYDALCRLLPMSRGEQVWVPRDNPLEGLEGLEVSPGLTEVRINVAGLAEASSQKIHNQISALNYLKDSDRIVAFADADIFLEPDWLRRLLNPINYETHPVATTYRWLVPETPHWANHLASAINGSVATMGGPEWCNLTWGGSYALAREVYDEVNLPEYYRGALNDDLQMAYVTRRHNKAIGFVRSLMRPSPIDHTWRSMFWFGWRQYFQVRIYAPYVWAISLVVTFFYVFAFITAWGSFFAGQVAALLPIGVMAVLNQMRATERARSMRLMFSEDNLIKLRSAMFLDRFCTVIGFLVHFLMVAATTGATRITWSGITYRVKSRQDTRVIKREPAA
jgi:cellulose synthase/poly-beta-1,6-N-acetylglucosamine synthase-like glycosyltransferase